MEGFSGHHGSAGLEPSENWINVYVAPQPSSPRVCFFCVYALMRVVAVCEQSVCSSVNEIACHAIPDDRPLQDGDLVSFDVSVFLKARCLFFFLRCLTQHFSANQAVVL